MKNFIKIIFITIFILNSLGHNAHAEKKDSVLRSGDLIKVDFPGEIAFDKPLPIDADGFLTLPEMGDVKISGKTLSEAQKMIRQSLSIVYKDISELKLILKERRLLVSVLGYVKKPGPVNLIAQGNIQMAINAAGNLKQGAQLDKIQVQRKGGMITVDYKKYLDTGDARLLPKLMPLDTIFVPASPLIGNVQVEFDAQTLTASGDAGEQGESVKVFGEVHRPGTFKYKDDYTLMDLLMRAGGVTRYAGVEQIRVISNGIPYPFNLKEYLDTGRPDLMPKVGKGDTVFIPQATEQVKIGAKIVYVMGEVFKPGAFETKAGATFFDILANSGGPTRFAETRQIRILRADGGVVDFDLQAYTEKTGAQKTLPHITPGDAILVPEKTDMNEKSWLKVAPDRAVMVIGAVNSPGRYEWADEMGFLDLLAHAGGPQGGADTSRIKIIYGEEDGEKQINFFDFEKFIKEGGPMSDVPEIKSGYTIVVPELPKDPNDNRSQWVRQETDRSIFIMGSVGAPGRYAFNENLTFLDILAAAQGPTANADLHNIRISHRRKGKETYVTGFNLAEYFEKGDEAQLPIVKPTDVIYVPDRNRNWLEDSKERTVRVLGSVAKPNRYEYHKDMTILDLLAEAGGPRQDAWQSHIVVVHILDGKPHAEVFDLVKFSKTGNFTDLPVVNVGDTVYVPDKSQSGRAKFRTLVNDAVSVVSLIAMIAAL